MSEFCRNCGAAQGSSRFCPSCGQPNLADTAGETPTSAAPANATGAMSGTMKGLLIGGAAVLVALVLVVVAALFFWTGDEGSVTTVVAPSTLPTTPATATPTPTVTATATATVTAVAPPVAPVVPVQPAFSGCPTGFVYVGNSGGYDVCRNSTISDGFAINIADVVSGPGSYSGVYSPARDKGYYFTCVAVGSGVLDCGYPPTNIANGGLVRLYP